LITFSSIESYRWFNFVLNEWIPKRNIVVLIPCSSTKPFHKSITHRSFFRKIWNMWYRGLLDLIIVSEPLTIVPAEYDYPKPRYPMYNYPPALIKNDDEFAYKERKIWRRRFEIFMNKIADKECYFSLYPYHREILGPLLETYCKAGIYVERPYITKGINLLMRMINSDKHCEEKFLHVNSRIQTLPTIEYL